MHSVFPFTKLITYEKPAQVHCSPVLLYLFRIFEGRVYNRIEFLKDCKEKHKCRLDKEYYGL